MLLPLERNQESLAGNMSNSKLQVTLLADEWKSSKGGLSTINRELAIHLAEHPNVSVTFLVPECTEDDKNESSACNVRIVKAQEHYAFNPVDLLSFPPDDLSIDIIIGHGVKLGKHAQIIKKSHQCKWVQVVHTAPEELSMLKTYSDCDNAIAKGDEKQWNEIKLCERADLVVAVGPRLWESYSRYLSLSGKHVFNLTPGIFSELSSLKLSIVEGKRFNVLLFGRGDSEDFELKGFDIAAKAVAQLDDTSYQLVFVGAPSGNEKQVAEKLLGYGLRKNQLIVKPFLENRKDLATLLSTADLAIIPSRSEGFGLTALEVLSAGRPFLVTQTSGFGEALQDALPQNTPWVVDSEESEKWAEAIKSVRGKGRQAAIAECQTLRESYGKKYIWETQCRDLVEKMVNLAKASPSRIESSVTAAPSQRLNEASIVYRPDEKCFKTHPEVKNAQLKDESELSSSAIGPLPKDQHLAEQRLEKKSGGKREGFTAHDFKTTSERKSSYFNSQGTTLEKNLSLGLERPKDVAVLGVSLTERSMEDVKKAFLDIAPKLNLSESLPMQNLQSVPKVKDYLMKNHLRFCVLVISADRIKSDREHQPEESRDYRQLFEIVANHVDAQALVLICGSPSLSKQDEVKVAKVVKDFVKGTEKIVIGWLRRGIFNLELDVLSHFLTVTSDVTRRGLNQGNSPDWGLRGERNRQVQTQQPQGATANYPATTERAHQESVVECELHYGQISQPNLNFLKEIHNFKVVDFIYANLLPKYITFPLASVKFFIDTSGYLRYIVEIRSAEDPEGEGVKILDNETLMLSTLVRYGNVSFANDDVQFHLKGFEMPQEIVKNTKIKFEANPKVRLFVVCDEKGQLRCRYITGALNTALGIVNKMCISVRNYLKK